MSDANRQQQLEYMINMYRMELQALEEKVATTLSVGSGEVPITIEGDEVPDAVWDGLKQMLNTRIERLESEFKHGQR